MATLRIKWGDMFWEDHFGETSPELTLSRYVEGFYIPPSHVNFRQPAEMLPVDPEYGFANWDDPDGAIDWDRMSAFLSDLKKTGILPPDHQSFDSFNETANVPVDADIVAEWRRRSEKLASEHLESHGEKLVWAIVDGFVLYWDKRVVQDLDIRAFIRVPEDIARSRREARSYYTPEGEVWRDPPQYWEKIVWPAYIRALQGPIRGRKCCRR
ncbi:hypothetical protein QCA50_002995 [Cerrena zonata]|uniref:Uncharacterized protein n=1 Tax=Cerrena zonata TaxID=2478898 RepID=A0AAW0GLA7_9APHY